MTSSEAIFYIGAGLVGLALLLAAAVIPIFVLAGASLRRRLEADYGKPGRNAERRERPWGR